MKILAFVLAVTILASCSEKSTNNSLVDQNLKGKVKSIKEFELKKNGSNKTIRSLLNANHFNQKGFISETHEYGENDSIVEKIIYNYNDSDLLLSKQALWPDGLLKWRLDYDYNQTDSLVTIKLSISDGIVLSSTNHRFIDGKILNPIKENKLQFGENHYDTDGNLIEKKIANEQSIIKYKYSGKILLEALLYNSTNKLISREIYRYDSKNNLTEKRDVQASGKITRLLEFEYIFDNEGNWISKKEMMDHKLVSTIEREIAYY